VTEVLSNPEQQIRARVEGALTAEEVNLNSERGRARPQQLIEQVLRDYEAEALNGQASDLAVEERGRIARALREDLVGLGAIAERMLSDPQAQEWMVNAPTRVFRDTGERIERCLTSSSPTIARYEPLSNGCSNRWKGNDRTDHPTRGGAPARRITAHRGDPTRLLQRAPEQAAVPVPASSCGGLGRSLYGS
jgi:hypothetical protein